jgi:CRP-like cAMP-binding protein
MTSDQPDLLRGLPAADAAAIVALGTPIALPAGAVLFGLGAPADCLYVIRRGRVALSLPMQIGGRDQDVVIEEHEPGETLGWSALVPPHRFTLRASAPLATEVLAIRRQDLLDFCAAHPEAGFTIGMTIAGVIGHRLHVFQAMWLRQMQRAVSRVDG